MIVDTSALVAIIKREPEQAAFSAILEAEKDLRISAATYFEASIVLDGLRKPDISRALDDLIERANTDLNVVQFPKPRAGIQLTALKEETAHGVKRRLAFLLTEFVK